MWEICGLCARMMLFFTTMSSFSLLLHSEGAVVRYLENLLCFLPGATELSRLLTKLWSYSCMLLLLGWEQKEE